MGTLVNCVSLGCHAYFAAALADVTSIRTELRQIRDNCCGGAVSQSGVANSTTIVSDGGKDARIRDILKFQGKIANDDVR